MAIRILPPFAFQLHHRICVVVMIEDFFELVHDIVAFRQLSVLYAEQLFDSKPLVVLQHGVESEVARQYECQPCGECRKDQPQVRIVFGVVEDCDDACGDRQRDDGKPRLGFESGERGCQVSRHQQSGSQSHDGRNGCPDQEGKPESSGVEGRIEKHQSYPYDDGGVWGEYQREDEQGYGKDS